MRLGSVKGLTTTQMGQEGGEKGNEQVQGALTAAPELLLGEHSPGRVPPAPAGLTIPIALTCLAFS